MDYTLLDSSPSMAHIQFPGKLNTSKVIWNAKIQTLQSIAQNNPDTGLRQFIEIPAQEPDQESDQENELQSILIGLNVQLISKPEILKTIIMITNYKNLSLGRHEYGERYYFNVEKIPT